MVLAICEMLRCPVCQEEYSDTGDLVPRLLPFSHTLCQGCVRCFLAGGRRTLTCPEDRSRHRAPEGERSFPQKPKFEMCPDHGRECSLYCNSSQCQRKICQLCLIKEHRNHDCADLEETRQEFCEKLLKAIDDLSGELMETKESRVRPLNPPMLFTVNKYNHCSGGSRISPRWGYQLSGGGVASCSFWIPGGARPKFYYVDLPLH